MVGCFRDRPRTNYRRRPMIGEHCPLPWSRGTRRRETNLCPRGNVYHHHRRKNHCHLGMLPKATKVTKVNKRILGGGSARGTHLVLAAIACVLPQEAPGLNLKCVVRPSTSGSDARTRIITDMSKFSDAYRCQHLLHPVIRLINRRAYSMHTGYANGYEWKSGPKLITTRG